MRSLFIAALAVAAAGPALAQSDFPEAPAAEMSGRPMGGQMRPPERENLAQMQARMTQTFNRLDANEDGVVDASELANARGGRMLARFDADADGRIRPFTGSTEIFITPGYRFRAVDVLMTNFHLPRSTLFMLVSAFAGPETMKAAYAHAVDNGYRFYSYGDACLLERST